MAAHTGDDLTCFRNALAQGDAGHAAHHLAGLVAEGRSPETEAAVAAFASAVSDPLAFVELGENVFVGTVALRAVLLVRASRGDEALSLILQAQAAVPGKDLLAWVAGCTDDEAFVRALDLDSLASIAFRIGHDHSVVGRAATLLDAVRRAREPHGVFAMTVARLKRMSGDIDGAIAIAEEEHRRAPSYATSIARGAAHGAKGQVDQAIAAFRDALKFSPEDVAARLEIGDLALSSGRSAEAAHAYAEALAREPRQEWAWPSQLYLLARDGDDASRAELRHLATGGNRRARSLLGQIEPFVVSLEPPDSSCVNTVRDALGRGYTPSAMAISSLEPPSAIAAMRTALAGAGKASDIDVTFSEIPKPDPRLARGAVDFLLWTYEGHRARPALPAPRFDVALAISSIASEPYDATHWSMRATEVAQQLDEAALGDVLAAMVHPPQAPENVAPWDWTFHVQVAAAFVCCRIGRGPWAGSPRARAIHALLYGPIDWTTTAAIIAVAELARAMPSLSPTIASEVLGPLVAEPSTSPVHYGCVYRPLVYSVLRLPDLPAQSVAMLQDLRRQLETDG